MNALLDGDIVNAQLLKQPLEQQRYSIFMTYDLQRAKEQLRTLYTGDHKTFGILCASGADRSKHVPVVPFSGRNVLPKPTTAYLIIRIAITTVKTYAMLQLNFKHKGLS